MFHFSHHRKLEELFDRNFVPLFFQQKKKLSSCNIVMTVGDSEVKQSGSEGCSNGDLLGQYEKRKRNAAILAGHYTWEKRMMEAAGIIVTNLLLLVIGRNVYDHTNLSNGWILALSLILSMVLADLFSGLVHWGADSWGSLETPLVGKSIIRSFREHHLDPLAMTRHDYIEANGDSHLVVLIPLLFLALTSIENNSQLFMVTFLTFTAFWVCYTNQVAKNAHEAKFQFFFFLLKFQNQSKICIEKKKSFINGLTRRNFLFGSLFCKNPT